MSLISQANVRTGFKLLRRQFSDLRNKGVYIIEHVPNGPEKDILLTNLEKEIDNLTDCLNVLTSLKER